MRNIDGNRLVISCGERRWEFEIVSDRLRSGGVVQPLDVCVATGSDGAPFLAIMPVDEHLEARGAPYANRAAAERACVALRVVLYQELHEAQDREERRR